MKKKLLLLLLLLLTRWGGGSVMAQWAVPAVPANPTADDWYDCGDQSGFSKFYFTLPTYDVNGNILDPEYLSYSIFTVNKDDAGEKLFTFPAEDYTFDLYEDITEVPYSLYSSAVDFHNYFVYMYRTNEGDNPLFTENIGIQVYYTVDGVENASDIVYLYPPSVVFKDDQDNSGILTEYNNKKVHATIEGRTIYTDGRWNTLCLPFNLSAEQLATSPLAGFEVKELDTEDNDSYDHITGYEVTTKTLWLNFKVAESIEAGKPYLVRNTPYLSIKTADEWNAFAAEVANGTNYEGKVVQLDDDITVTTMVGTDGNRFKGTFDGNGHKLTVKNLPSSDQYCAPFRFVDGATIRNLHTEGTLSGNQKYISGLIGDTKGNVNIYNCQSSVTINSTVNGDGTHGGFIGVANGDIVTIDNCLFDGKFQGTDTNCWGGLVGWSNAATTVKNSAFMPAEISVNDNGSATFGRHNVTTNNCYYSTALGETQGTLIGDMAGSELATALGSGWQVSDSKAVPVMTKTYITDPVFKNVVIKSDAPTDVVGGANKEVVFRGVYAPIVMSDKRSVLFLKNNSLYYPDGSEETTIGAFRAYFPLNGIHGGDPTSESSEDYPEFVRSLMLNFGDGDATAVEMVNGEIVNAKSDAWYDLNGRKLNQKPAQRGIYLNNGRKVLVNDNK